MLRISGLSVSVLLTVAAGAAQAQEAPSPLAPLYDCTALSAEAERLACFDRTVADLRAKESSRDIVAIDAETAQDIQTDGFGFRLPSLPKLALPKLGGGDADRVAIPIASVTQTGRNAVFTLENGQVWRQTDNDRKRIPKSRTGEPIIAHIRSAAFDSFLMSVEVDGKMRAKGMRVKRVR